MSSSAQASPTRQTNQRVAVIKALAHPTRLTLAESLVHGERCVCDLREVVGGDLSTVSKHLAVLRQAGILDMEKRGLNVFYRLRCTCLLSFLDCVDSLASPLPATRTQRR